jgi:hypothetical protein
MYTRHIRRLGRQANDRTLHPRGAAIRCASKLILPDTLRSVGKRVNPAFIVALRITELGSVGRRFREHSRRQRNSTLPGVCALLLKCIAYIRRNRFTAVG